MSDQDAAAVDAQARVMVDARDAADVVRRLGHAGVYAYAPDVLVTRVHSALVATATSIGQVVRERSDEDGLTYRTLAAARRAHDELGRALEQIAEDG